jgi:hypothetical protein
MKNIRNSLVPGLGIIVAGANSLKGAYNNS